MKRANAVAIVAVILFSRPAGAQQCKVGETVRQCFERVTNKKPQLKSQLAPAATPASETASVAAVAALTETSVSENLSLRNTGVQGLALGQNASTGDFANDLLALLESSGAGTRVGDTVTVGIGFPMSAEADKKKLKFTVALTDPKLNQDVSSKLSGKDLDDAKSSIDQGARDLTFAFAWAFKQRSVAPVVAQAWSTDRRGTFSSTSAHQDSSILADPIIRAINHDTDAFINQLDGDEIVTESNRTAVEVMVSNTRAEERRLRTTWAEQTIRSYARLAAAAADEQSQFWGEARYHYRDPLIGAKEAKVSFTYEFGANGTASETLKNLMHEDLSVEQLLARSDSGTTPSAKPGITVKGEYSQVQTRHFDLPALTSLIKPSRHVLSLSAVAGWSIPTLSKDRTAKLDFNGTFENDSGDAKKRNRVIASLMFTQKLSEKFSLPLTFAYASHSSDLDVNRRLSAHFGISYKLPTGDAATQTEKMRAAIAAEN